MTTTTISSLARPDHATARRILVPTAIGVAVVTSFFEMMRADSQGEAFSMTALGLVANALVLGLLVPRLLRRESASVPALVTSVIALLLVYPAFWSQLPLVLGAAGALLGFAGKRATARSGVSIAALVVGLIAVIGYLAIFIGDWIAHPGASWWS